MPLRTVAPRSNDNASAGKAFRSGSDHAGFLEGVDLGVREPGDVAQHLAVVLAQGRRGPAQPAVDARVAKWDDGRGVRPDDWMRELFEESARGELRVGVQPARGRYRRRGNAGGEQYLDGVLAFSLGEPPEELRVDRVVTRTPSRMRVESGCRSLLRRTEYRDEGSPLRVGLDREREPGLRARLAAATRVETLRCGAR